MLKLDLRPRRLDVNFTVLLGVTNFRINLCKSLRNNIESLGVFWLVHMRNDFLSLLVIVNIETTIEPIKNHFLGVEYHLVPSIIARHLSINQGSQLVFSVQLYSDLVLVEVLQIEQRKLSLLETLHREQDIDRFG